MKLVFLLECPPAVASAARGQRLESLAATRCYGGGGGSADQSQTQQQTSTNSQQGVSDEGVGVFGDNNSVVNQNVSAEAIEAGLAAAADIAKTGADAAYWTGADAQETARHMGDVAYWTAADAQTTAQTVSGDLSDVAKHSADVGYWTAAEGLSTARDLNAQNTNLLTKLAGLFGAGAANSADNMRQLSEASLDFGSDTIGQALNFGGDVVAGAIGLAGNTTKLVADNYTRNTEALANNYDKSISGMLSLAQSASTGGQTEVNKSFVKIIAIVGAVLALMFMTRK